MQWDVEETVLIAELYYSSTKYGKSLDFTVLDLVSRTLGLADHF